MNHIDQEAELYALGMLDDEERARIDDHLTSCEACTARVGAAEAAVAALVDTTQERKPERRTAWWPVAAAAAFALTAMGLLGQNVVMRGALASDGAVLALMVNSHFDHTQFQAPGGADIAAKAIYERHGKWFEVLADGAPDWHVVFVRPNGSREPALKAFARRGAASVVFAAQSLPVKAIDLEDAGGHVVGSVHPVMQAEQEEHEGGPDVIPRAAM